MSVPVRAWVKPLKNGSWQYFARVGKEQRIMGAANNAEQAHDLICDYVYGNESYKHDGATDWRIEWKTS